MATASPTPPPPRTGAVHPWRHAFPVRAWLTALPFVSRIPALDLDDLFPGIGEVEVTLRHSVRERALGHGEAFVLALVTRMLKPRRIFEIGTASGQATALMAAQAPKARIDTLDLGNDRPSLGTQRGQPPWRDLGTIGAAYREAGFGDRVVQHFGDSATFDYGPFRGAVDLVLVDGGHTYEYVLSDGHSALAMLAPGGVAVFDDCTWASPGVSRALVALGRDGTPAYRVPGTRLAVIRTQPGKRKHAG